MLEKRTAVVQPLIAMIIQLYHGFHCISTVRMLETKKEKLENVAMNIVEDVPSIVVEGLKGRNITVVKAKDNPPKNVKIFQSNDEEDCIKKNIETKDEPPKPKRTKITKKVIEERLISAYVFDAEVMIYLN